jgi:hypothetical protein
LFFSVASKLSSHLLIFKLKVVFILVLSSTLKEGLFAGVGKLVEGMGIKFMEIVFNSKIFLAKSYQLHCPSLEKL